MRRVLLVVALVAVATAGYVAGRLGAFEAGPERAATEAPAAPATAPVPTEVPSEEPGPLPVGAAFTAEVGNIRSLGSDTIMATIWTENTGDVLGAPRCTLTVRDRSGPLLHTDVYRTPYRLPGGYVYQDSLILPVPHSSDPPEVTIHVDCD